MNTACLTLRSLACWRAHSSETCENMRGPSLQPVFSFSVLGYCRNMSVQHWQPPPKVLTSHEQLDLRTFIQPRLNQNVLWLCSPSFHFCCTPADPCVSASTCTCSKPIGPHTTWLIHVSVRLQEIGDPWGSIPAHSMSLNPQLPRPTCVSDNVGKKTKLAGRCLHPKADRSCVCVYLYMWLFFFIDGGYVVMWYWGLFYYWCAVCESVS